MFKGNCESIPGNSSQQKQLTNYDELNFPLPELLTFRFFSHNIICFRDEGDFLLLLPDVLVKVLPEFSHLDVFTACQFFKIPCSECNPAQLKCLKLYSILRAEVDCSFLMSWREVNRLRRRIASTVVSCRKLPLKLKVYHECLGRCEGFFMMEFHLSRHAPCISCQVCSEMMNPQEFVCHSHNAEKDLMYKQDFHPNMWWKYIEAHESFRPKFLAQRILNELKFKFWDFSRVFQTHTKGPEQQEISLTHADFMHRPLTNDSPIDLSNRNRLSDKK